MIKKIQLGAVPTVTDSKTVDKLPQQKGKRHKLNELKAAQEKAHQKSAYLDGPKLYQYERGPDGKTYTVDATATIDTSPVPGDPQATIRKMKAIQRGAKAISAAVLQQAAKAAKQTEEAAQFEIQNSGLGEAEMPAWGDTLASRLVKASAPTEEGSDLEQKEQEHTRPQQPGGLSKAKTSKGSRALSAYRGLGEVLNVAPQQLHPFGIKAK